MMRATARTRETIASPVMVKSVRERLSQGSVEWSPDVARIFTIPRRAPPTSLVEPLTARLKRPEGTMRLRPIQAWALHEAHLAGGILGHIAVGAGKELLGLLMPMVMPECKVAVLFIPPSLREQFRSDLDFYGKHWVLPSVAGGKFFVGRPVLHIVSYSELSNPKSSAMLDRLRPDLIIANECQNFRRYGSARVKRFLRYASENECVRFCGWSGTLTAKSVRDYAHLSFLALGERSPLPILPNAVDQWSKALDPDTGGFFDPGVLRMLCTPGEDTRSGFRRRLVDSLGVIATAERALGTSLIFRERKATVPKVIAGHLRKLHTKEPKRPDGEILVDALAVSECARQLACGFFYRWVFPKNEPKELRDAWFARRQEWNRELRAKLLSSEQHLDSPKLCENAAVRFYQDGCPKCERKACEDHEKGCIARYDYPLWAADTWPAWSSIKDKVYHEVETVWEDDFLLKNVAAWAAEKPGIVWVEYPAFGHKLAQVTKLHYYGGGSEASIELTRLAEAAREAKATSKVSIIASISAHGTGKNLQHAFCRNLLVTPSADNAQLEQTVGRTHREGQPEDEVDVFYFGHTPELVDALRKARMRARFVAETTGSPQKLVYGSWAVPEDS